MTRASVDGAAVEVTVFALCFNHAAYVIDCLESIRRQTFQDFQLVVTDDASTDGSDRLIREWLAANRPDAVFLRNEVNRGLCPTLNAALGESRGTYISMVAADDLWEPTKLAAQLECMRSQPSDIAVVYSDARQIDESGRPLPGTVLSSHGHGDVAPSGHLFSTLADGNFIPAMATLIRRQAIVDVGGYDEALTYEDYDMWLRLSARGLRFQYLPGRVASYRIVSTSMVRTLFVRPTPRHSVSSIRLRLKWMGGQWLTSTQRKHWAAVMAQAAYSLYVHGDARAGRLLWVAAWHNREFRLVLLAVAASLGISQSLGNKISSLASRKRRNPYE